jgi:hypothetical protein
MKKLMILAAGILTLNAIAQENNTWRLGASFGLNNNQSKFSGGMPDANARFHHNQFGTGAMEFTARFDYTNHWMGTAGLGLTSTGYQFALSENYSLLNKSKQFSTIKSDFGKIEMPVMLFYKLSPNCKNTRWLAGGGFVPTWVEGKTTDNSYEQTIEGTISSDYLSSTITSKGGAYLMLRGSIAREKILKNGSLLNVALLFNLGFKEMTKAAVNYTVDNQNYLHSFTGKGNFIGFRIFYFLKPVSKPVTSKK